MLKRAERSSARRWIAGGVALGVVCYVALLLVHVVKFGSIEYGVPNIGGWAGRFPGYGWTWELTALNVPPDLASRIPPLRGRWVLHVIPQVVTGHRHHPEVPGRWSTTGWLLSGVTCYAFAGFVLGMLAAGARLAYERIATART